MDNIENLKEGFFPRFIDRPRLIGIFEFDEFILTFGVIFTVIASSLAFPKLGSLSVMLIAVFLGVSLGYAYKKFKRNRPNGYTWHFLYKIGAYHPTDNKLAIQKYKYLKKEKAIPYGFTKEFFN
jgi:hypothetical protein